MSCILVALVKLFSLCKSDDQPSDVMLMNKPSCYFNDGKNRLLTFRSMGWGEAADPVELAESGFVAIDSKTVQCVWCAVGLTDWLEEHVPIVEHMLASPRCSFIAGYDVNNFPLISDPIRGRRHPMLVNNDVVD